MAVVDGLIVTTWKSPMTSTTLFTGGLVSVVVVVAEPVATVFVLVVVVVDPSAFLVIVVVVTAVLDGFMVTIEKVGFAPLNS